MEVARRAQASANGRRLFVSGVAPEVKKTDLQREFGEFGHVTDIELPLTAKGVAFVEFDNALDAADALEEVTGRKLKGMVLKVKMADIQKTRSGGNEGLDGMVRVENDYRGPKGGGKGYGGGGQVVPTGKQEYEQRRMPLRQPPPVVEKRSRTRSRSRGGGGRGGSRGGGGGDRGRDREPSAGRGRKNRSHSRRREASRSRSASRRKGASRSRSRRKDKDGGSKARKRDDASRSAGRRKGRKASRSVEKKKRRRGRSPSGSGRSGSS